MSHWRPWANGRARVGAAYVARSIGIPVAT